MFRMPENKIPFGPDHPFYVPEPSRWNRKMFYDSDADLVSFEPANEKIDADSILAYAGIPGVWSVWGAKESGDEMLCLDVHETLDIAYEIRMHEKRIGLANKTPWDDPLYAEYPYHFSMYKRMKAIAQYDSLSYVLVSSGVQGKINREVREAQYAFDNKAIYWNRNYYQAVTKEAVEIQRANPLISSIK